MLGVWGTLLVGEVLLFSATFKFLRPDEFRQAVQALARVPETTRRLAYPIVPLVELGAALGAMIPRTAVTGLSIATALLLVLSVIILVDPRPSLARCGCWGSVNVEVPKSAYLVRNGVIIGVSILTVGVWPPSDVNAGTWILSAGMMAPFALLILELPHLLHVTVAHSADGHYKERHG